MRDSRNSALSVVALLLGVLLFCDVVKADYPEELVAVARKSELHNDPQWHALLHYQSGLFGLGQRGLADYPGFYNSPDGKSSPEAELEATILSFFTPEAEDYGALGQHPQCAFIARYDWLKERLQIDPSRLPAPRCERFEEWYEALDPKTVALVFPSAFLNNPASMFGHTLLRIDAHGQDDSSRLLAYASNYAASTGGENALLYAFKGLFGGYRGFFSVEPYYNKIKKYSDIENRDIWVYELAFEPEEVKRLVLHLWELRSVYFDYYYFDENCSYHLLSLLDAARPGLNLSDQFSLWALPVDTVRAVVEEPDLVKRVTFRASRSTELLHKMQFLAKDEAKLVRLLANGLSDAESDSFQGLSPDAQARVAEAAFEYVHYLRVSGDLSEADSAKRLYSIARVRSELPIGSAVSNVPVPETRPDEGHETRRAGFAGGVEDGRLFAEFSFRPVYHDLLDPEPGYVRGSQIQFFQLAFRQEEENGLELERFIPLDILSLFPRRGFVDKVSWRVQVGAKRKPLYGQGKRLVGELNGGAGTSFSLGESALFYALLDASLEYSARLEEDYAIGAGPVIGILGDLTESWRLHFVGQGHRYFLGADHKEALVSLEQRVAVDANNALVLSIAKHWAFEESYSSMELSWLYYF